MYEQSSIGESPGSQWSETYSLHFSDEDKARATNHIPSIPTTPAETDGRQCEQLHIAESNWMSISQTVRGVPPNTDSPSPITPSHGPRRSEGAKGKRKATQRARGKRRCGSVVPLAEGIESSWEQTKNRFVWRLLEEYYFRPAGGLINPETAFATINIFIKEDLHRSPLAAQAATAKADKKESRVYEQYLTHILKELRRSREGEMQNEVLMYTQVLQELKGELAPVNERSILKEGHPANKVLIDVGNSSGKVRHREAEKARRAAIRNLQDQISLYFLVPGKKKISVGDLLLYVVVYLRIGQRAFPGRIQPFNQQRSTP